MTETTNQYPKMLYLGGDRTAESRIVSDGKEEKAAKDEGFLRVKHDAQIAQERAEADRKAAETAEAERQKAEQEEADRKAKDAEKGSQGGKSSESK